MNRSCNKKDSEGISQNPKKTSVRKTPFKARSPPVKPVRKHRNVSLKPESTSNDLSPKEKFGIEREQQLLNTDSGAYCLDSSMSIESTSRILPPKETSGIEDLQEPFNTESGANCLDSSMSIESTSNILPPKGTSGIEDLQEPFNIESCASYPDLSLENEDVNTNRNIDRSLESYEDCKIHQGYYDSSSGAEQFKETHTDGKSRQIINPSYGHETWTKIKLPRMMVQNVARFLGEELDRSNELAPDMKMHLLIAKNMIEEQLAIDDDGPASTGEAGEDLERPVCKGSRDASVKLLQNMIDTSIKLNDIVVDYEESLDLKVSKELLQEMLKTSMELSKIVLDYEKSRDPRFGRKSAPAKLIQKIMDTCLDLIEIVLEYEESLNPRFSKSDRAKLLQEMTDTNIKLSDMVLDYLETSHPSYSGWMEEYWEEEEDPQNTGSFPTFVANFLLIAALFAVLVFPALFLKYPPSEFLAKSVLTFFNISQSAIT